MTLNEFKSFISKRVAPCKNPKIYFNGLLMQNNEQTLSNYGIKDRSSLYINTENIVGELFFEDLQLFRANVFNQLF